MSLSLSLSFTVSVSVSLKSRVFFIILIKHALSIFNNLCCQKGKTDFTKKIFLLVFLDHMTHKKHLCFCIEEKNYSIL